MKQKYIEDKMHELEKIINYKFNNINLLCEAMNATKIKYGNAGKNKDIDSETVKKGTTQTFTVVFAVKKKA